MEAVVLVFACIHKLFTRPGGNNREDWRCTGHAMATKQKLITSIQLCKLKKGCMYLIFPAEIQCFLSEV